MTNFIATLRNQDRFNLRQQNLQEFGAMVEDCPDDIVRIAPPPVLLGEDFDLDRSPEPSVFHPIAKSPVIDHTVTQHAPIKADIFDVT